MIRIHPLAAEYLQENIFNTLCFSVFCACCTLHGTFTAWLPVFRPREFLFPKWSETVKFLSSLSSLWVALAEQMFCYSPRNILLFLLIQYMIVYVKELFN